MGKIVHGPWLTRDDVQQVHSLQNFRVELRKGLNDFKEKQPQVSNVCQFFSNVKYVCPIECDTAVIYLQTLRQPIQGLCSLLNNPFHLPTVVISYRYPLLTPLYYLDEQVSQLISFITRFRSICLESSRQTTNQQHVIGERLEEVVASSQEIEKTGREILHQLYFSDVL
jgi:hypothetical protein